MSSYTTELKTICESYAGFSDIAVYDNIDDIIAKALPKLFNFNFPIFNESYRITLETKIIKHYYTREISEETVGLWKLRLDSKLNEIMPYYNKLYSEIENAVNLFNNKNITVTYKRNNEGNGITRNLYSDTPQGSLMGVEAEEYLTNANKNINNATTTEEYLENTKGIENISNIDSFNKFIKYYKDIDMMIIDELKVIFMSIW